MAHLELSLLGGFTARVAAGPALRLPTKKAEALLAYLALPAGQAHARDKLASLLWSEASDEQARGSLRRTLADIRKVLAEAGGPSLAIDGRTVALDPGSLEVDAATVERLVADGTPAALERVVALYQGDLLAGHAVDETLFEEWLVRERERLRELALEALARLLNHQTKTELLDPAIQTAARLLALDPLQEAVHRTLMRLYARQGRRASALRQYQSCTQALQRELGVEPEKETQALYRELLRQRAASPAPSRAAARAPADVDAGAGPLVGRDAERAALADALDRLAARAGGLVVLLGEAGMGKSRLVASLVGDAAQRGVRVCLGRAYPSEQVLAFGPWTAALRTAPLGELAGRLEPVWRAELTRLLPELDPTVPPTLLTADYSRLFEALARLLAEAAAAGPVVLVLEDVQWADEMSLRLLAFLSRRLADAAVLLVATVRVDEVVDAPALRDLLRELERDPRARLLSLAPLPREETARLVRLLRRGAPGEAMADLEERAWRLSQGNPFVIVETVQAMATAAADEHAALPARVRGLVLARLERLSAPAREVVAVAAVVGREFDLRTLELAARMDDAGIAAAVEELVRRHLVRAIGERFDFTHEHIREVAYAAQPARHAALHARVAEALETLGAGRPDASLEALAHHYGRTDNAPKAVEYLTRFAEAAARAFAHEDAIRALDRALAHAARLPEDRRDHVRIDLLLRRAFSMSVLGRIRAILEALVPEEAVVERLGDAALAAGYHFRVGLAHSILGDQASATTHASRAIALAPDDATRGRASYVFALASFWSGHPLRGVEPAAEAVRLLERSNERHFLGLAHWILALNRLLLGEFQRALEAAAAVEAVGQELSDPRVQCLGASTTGWVLATAGDTARGLEACRLGVERARDPMGKSAAEGYLGFAHLEHGEAEQALPLLERSVAGLTKFGMRQTVGRMEGWLALAHLACGHADQAKTAAERALEAGTLADCRDVVAQARRALGRIATAAGSFKDAREHLGAALDGFVEIGAPFEEARTRLALAELALAARDPDAAARELARARELFAAWGAAHFVARVDALANSIG
jgi:DNA-binding SARP family transcriptional activator